MNGEGTLPYASVQFSRSVVSDSLRPHGLQHARLPCPSPTPGACSNSCSLSQWCHPTISSTALRIHVSFLPQTPIPSRLVHNWAEFHVLCSKSLLVLHFDYGSVYKTFPNSLTIPSPCPFPRGSVTPFSSLWVSFSFVNLSSFVSFIFRFHL